jgi:hypothetical protein
LKRFRNGEAVALTKEFDLRCQDPKKVLHLPRPSANPKRSPMYILRALVFLFLAQLVLAEQLTPILPDAKLTPGDTFDITV